MATNGTAYDKDNVHTLWVVTESGDSMRDERQI